MSGSRRHRCQEYVLCDVCEMRMLESEVKLFSIPRALRRLNRSTGFEELVQEIQDRYGLRKFGATRAAQEIWMDNHGAFRAPYQLTALKKTRDHLVKKLTECNFMIDELEHEINLEIEIRRRIRP